MTLRLSTKLATWIDEELPPLLLGDKAEFELVIAMGPQGPLVIVTLFAPGPVLGSTMLAVAQMENPAAVTKEGINQMLAGLIRMLADERTKQLSVGNGTPIHPSNEPPGPPGGHLRGL